MGLAGGSTRGASTLPIAKKTLALRRKLWHGRRMFSIRLRRLAPQLEDFQDARIEKRCDDCGVDDHAKIRAISVTDTSRCDACQRPLWSGVQHWAIFVPIEPTDQTAS